LSGQTKHTLNGVFGGISSFLRLRVVPFTNQSAMSVFLVFKYRALTETCISVLQCLRNTLGCWQCCVDRFPDALLWAAVEGNKV